MWYNVNNVIQDEDEHVGTARSAACPERSRSVQPSKARRPDHPFQKYAHFNHFADKTGLCFETEPDGMRMPRGQVTTIGSSVPRAGVGVNAVQLGSQPVDQPRVSPVE